MFPFLGWQKSPAASLMGLMTSKELISFCPVLGTVWRHVVLAGLSQSLLGSSRRLVRELR